MRWLGLVLAVGVQGCFYGFDNPVETDDGGTLSGQVVLVNPAADQTTANATVVLQWSGGLTATLDATGHFAFLGLSDGTYSLAYQVPALAANDMTLSGLRPGILLPDVPDDAVDLGQLQLTAGATVTGTLSGMDGPTVVAAFAPDGGLYEGYHAAVDDGGGFSLTVPAGTHDLVASTADLAATVTLTLQPGEQKVTSFALQPATGGGQVTGTLVFVGPGLGADVGAPTDLTAGLGFGATQNGTSVGGGLITSAGGDAGVSAVSLAPGTSTGQTVDVTLSLPGGATATADGPGGQVEGPYGPLMLPSLPLIAGRNTALGQITWVPLAVFALNGVDAGM